MKSVGRRTVRLPAFRIEFDDNHHAYLWAASLLHVESDGDYYSHGAFVLQAVDQEEAERKAMQRAVEVFGDEGEVCVIVTRFNMELVQ